jgi:hypothetical protein
MGPRARGRFAAVEGLGVTSRRVVAVAGAAALALAAGACGGGPRQDAGEPSGRFEIAVTKASFPARQRLAEPARLVLAVKNTGTRALPNVAVTIDSFFARSEQMGLADPDRAVWVIADAPLDGTTATASTWALGRLQPGATKRFSWRVVPVQGGTHDVHWRVAASLNGRAEAVLDGNRTPEGEFAVAISGQPSAARVDPATGDVIRTGG